MVLCIWGTRTTLTPYPPSHQETARLGPNPSCPRANCPGACAIFELRKMCTWMCIPIFPCSTRDVVKCLRCGTCYDAQAYLQAKAKHTKRIEEYKASLRAAQQQAIQKAEVIIPEGPNVVSPGVEMTQAPFATAVEAVEDEQDPLLLPVATATPA